MKALIIVDMQKDFMPSGSLPTKEADQIIPIINELMDKFPIVVATKDWHPKDHIGFAKNHPGKNVGEVIEVDGIKQILWPIHCVQGTPGAEFADGLNHEKVNMVFLKGEDPNIDSYSIFFDAGRLRNTGLEDFLKGNGIEDVTIVGVATDYCVLYSALDAIQIGLYVTVVSDGCKAINLKIDDEKKAVELMGKKGVKILRLDDFR